MLAQQVAGLGMRSGSNGLYSHSGKDPSKQIQDILLVIHDQRAVAHFHGQFCYDLAS